MSAGRFPADNLQQVAEKSLRSLFFDVFTVPFHKVFDIVGLDFVKRQEFGLSFSRLLIFVTGSSGEPLYFQHVRQVNFIVQSLNSFSLFGSALLERPPAPICPFACSSLQQKIVLYAADNASLCLSGRHQPVSQIRKTAVDLNGDYRHQYFRYPLQKAFSPRTTKAPGLPPGHD
jgi:hypothetical protein